MAQQPETPKSRGGRSDRLIQERVHDPYKSKSKLPEPTVCPQCHAVYHEGRWTWMARPARSHEELCPACHRIRDKYPAGFLTLKGEFLKAHQEEILNLARNEEEEEKAEHPLQRIMAIEQEGEAIVLTTTDMHLVRRIGEALHHAYHGELEVHYIEEGSILRVSWQR